MRAHTFLLLVFVGTCFSAPVPIKYESTTTVLKAILNKVSTQNSIKCQLCKYSIEAIGYVLKSGYGKEKLKKLTNYFCRKFEIESHRVCVGAINEFVDEVWGVFVNGYFLPDEICGLVLGRVCAIRPTRYGSWNITIPPRTKDTPVSSNIGIKTGKGPTTKILHLSDTHLDPDYLESAVAECREPLCCRKENGLAAKGQIAAGKYGYPGFCDTNELMLHSMFQDMVDRHNDAEYIIWTGDVPAHNIWNQSHTNQKAAISHATNIFKKYFPNKKIYPTLGNHEGVPVNSFPPPEIWSSSVPNDNWLFEEVANDWGNWLPKECLQTIRKGGYYTALIRKGLRLVSLNTNYGTGDNWWLQLKSDDPAGQLQWLSHVLYQAEKNHEKVHIIGHTPSNALITWFSYNYYKLVDRFRNTITGLFVGHTHHDEFRVFYDRKTYKTPIGVEYLGPSVTTYLDMNPGYRVYDLDVGSENSSMSVVDHHTYFLNLTKTAKTGVAKFELEYSAKSTYKMTDLSPSSWNDLLERMATDDELFQHFYRSFYKQFPHPACSVGCKKQYLCTMKSAVNWPAHNFCRFADKDEERKYEEWKVKTYNKC